MERDEGESVRARDTTEVVRNKGVVRMYRSVRSPYNLDLRDDFLLFLVGRLMMAGQSRWM